MATRLDQSRLDRASTLVRDLPTGALTGYDLDTLHVFCARCGEALAALQSLNDLGSSAANAAAMAEIYRLSRLHRRLEEAIATWMRTHHTAPESSSPC